jgi:hypothetical protein
MFYPRIVVSGDPISGLPDGGPARIATFGLAAARSSDALYVMRRETDRPDPRMERGEG